MPACSSARPASRGRHLQLHSLPAHWSLSGRQCWRTWPRLQWVAERHDAVVLLLQPAWGHMLPACRLQSALPAKHPACTASWSRAALSAAGGLRYMSCVKRRRPGLMLFAGYVLSCIGCTAGRPTWEDRYEAVMADVCADCFWNGSDPYTCTCCAHNLQLCPYNGLMSSFQAGQLTCNTPPAWQMAANLQHWPSQAEASVCTATSQRTRRSTMSACSSRGCQSSAEQPSFWLRCPMLARKRLGRSQSS